MTCLTIENLSKSFGERTLFKDVTLYLAEGQKVALIARNGTGKTSLLNIISGKEGADGGKVWIHKDIRHAFLEQEPSLDPKVSVFDTVYNAEGPVMQAVAAYERCLRNHSDETAMQKAISDMDRLQAWDYDVKVKTILSKLQVDDLELPVGVLSGGQKKRVALARTLIDEPELLILDEPTNHLDLDMIEWLEEFLKTSSITLLLVSHDRYFLESVCDTIIELDQETLFKYTGNYADYLIAKAERQENLIAQTDKAKNLFRKELDWMRRQPKARGTKAKSRIDAFFEVEEKAKRKLDDDELIIDIQPNRLGGKIVELHNVSKAYGDKILLDKFDYKFMAGDRVGVIGRNGVGKSTLLNLINELETPDTGKVVLGDTVVLGYYNQSGMNFKEEAKVIDVIRDIAEFIPMRGGKKLTASQLLEQFMFEPKAQQNFVYKLSGGEKRRLHLLTILIKNPNFLILDEPTNDLDLLTLQVLEQFLQRFEGVLLIVSHDRHFMDKLVEHTFVFEGNGKVVDFPGNYSAWRAMRDKTISDERKQASANAKLEQAKPVVVEGDKLNYDERKELGKLEKELAKLQEQKEALSAQYLKDNLQATDFERINKELQVLQDKIDEKEMRWLELAERA
jgi:ATP-binding cassette subfamily F protein uup